MGIYGNSWSFNHFKFHCTGVVQNAIYRIKFFGFKPIIQPAPPNAQKDNASIIRNGLYCCFTLGDFLWFNSPFKCECSRGLFGHHIFIYFLFRTVGDKKENKLARSTYWSFCFFRFGDYVLLWSKIHFGNNYRLNQCCACRNIHHIKQGNDRQKSPAS